MKKRNQGPRAALFFFAALAAACLTRLFVLDRAAVSGESMLPALEDGRKVFVSKLAWGLRLPLSTRYLLRWKNPEPGEIVIFLRNGAYNIKRCVGTEGTDIVFSDENGYSVTVGDTWMPLSKAQYENLAVLLGAAESGNRAARTRVPPGSAFVAGDNPSRSVDSRDYGFVSTDSFCGKVLHK